VPVGGRPDVRDGIDLGGILGGRALEAQVVLSGKGEKFVDDLEAGVTAETVDAAEVEQHVVAERIAAEEGDVMDPGSGHGDGRLATELGGAEDVGAELGGEFGGVLLGKGGGAHRRDSSRAFFWSRKECSVMSLF